MNSRVPTIRFAPGLVLAFGFLALADHRTASPAAESAEVGGSATIRISASRAEGKVDPLLYGQFLEYMFECIKFGLHAELLRDRGFEEAANVIGLPRDWDRYPDNRDDDALAFAPDASVFYPDRNEAEPAAKRHSLRIRVDRGIIRRHGLSQGRIPVRANTDFVGSFWLKTDDYEGRVSASLESEVEGTPPYAVTVVEHRRGDWHRCDFRLKPRATDPAARLVILLEGKGTVWIDQASLMPGDAVDGVRLDVLQRVRDLKPGFIRWPGGNVAQDYHWRWGVGPRDQRPFWTNLSWKNEREPSDFGTDEYLRFCSNVGATPTIVVNVEGRGATVEEAAQWVEYCNGPATSGMGALRAANGHPEPYGVKLWEIGNEIWGDWVRGHSDAETYARNFLRYEAAMRAVDPSIRLIACGDNNMEWNRTVLARVGEKMDYLSIHHYYGSREMGGDPQNLMAHPLYYEAFYRKVAAAIKELVPGKPIRLAINEWGLALPIEQEYSIDAALYAGRLMNVFERSNIVAMSSVSDLVNGWAGGIIQAGRHGVFVNSVYVVNQLYARRLGRDRLAVTVDGPTFDTSHEGRQVPVLDAVATRSADGKQLYLKAVNTDRMKPIRMSIAVEGAKVASNGTLEWIQSSAPGSYNSFATPNAIAIRTRELEAGPRVDVELPAGSVAVVTLNLVP
jgi:alpha-N-arabinofuranosidase